MVVLYAIWKSLQNGIDWLYERPVKGLLYRKRRKLRKMQGELERMKREAI